MYYNMKGAHMIYLWREVVELAGSALIATAFIVAWYGWKESR